MRFFRSLRHLSGALVISLLLNQPSAIFAEGPAALKPSLELKVALDKGLAAAQLNDFDTAIRHFNDAFEKAPFDPLVHFNLGLAHTKAGHELAAIAWFRAYLQAGSRTNNREEIEKAIADLEVAARAKAADIFKQAEEAASVLIEDGFITHRSLAFRSIFSVYAGAGDIDKAVAFAEERQIRFEHDPKSEALHDHGVWLVSDKEMGQALEIAQQLPEKLKQDLLQKVLNGYLYSLTSDLEKALEVFQLFPKPEECLSLSSLAEGLAKKGDWDGAAVLVEKQKYESVKVDSWIALARIALKESQSERARGFLLKAEKVLPPGDAYAAYKLAGAYAEIDDDQAAERVMGLYPPESTDQGYAYKWAEVYAKIGDIKKMKKYFAMIASKSDKESAASTIIDISIKRKDLKTARSYLAYLHPEVAAYPFAELAWALVLDGKEGDARKIIKTVPANQAGNQEDLMYSSLTNFAATDGDIGRALEYLGKIQNPGWKYQGVAAIAGAEIKKGKYDEAFKLLLDHADIAYPSGWLGFIDSFDKAGRRPDALRLLAPMTSWGSKLRDINSLEKIAEYYEKFGNKERADQVRSVVWNLRWIILAKEIERWQTHDSSAALTEIQKKYSPEIPGALANLAQGYLVGLEKIQKMKEMLS